MKRSIVVMLLPLFLSCVTTEPPPPLTGPVASQEKPLNFKLPKFSDGATYELANDRGDVVIIDIWATWCEPCKDALPMWQEVARQYGPRGLKIYALNVDQDRNQIEKFIAESKLTLPVLHDPDGTVVGPTLKVAMMPTTFLIDRKGYLRFVHEGFAEEQLAKYEAQIQQLLAEKVE